MYLLSVGTMYKTSFSAMSSEISFQIECDADCINVIQCIKKQLCAENTN